MSATGRGTVREEKDFYATPIVAFEPLLPHLPRGVAFWEPCAGDGRIVRWLRQNVHVCQGAEIQPAHQFGRESDAWYLENIQNGNDYLGDFTQRDFVITNPPFSRAFEMCQHALVHSREFMFLLRLSFLESEERGAWFEKHEPNGLWVLKKRPSFVMSVTCKSVVTVAGETAACKHNWLLPIESERPKVCPKCGGTKLAISTSDSSGYAWYYWGPRRELSGIHHI